MGVLTDLVIADKSEAENVANSFEPSSEWNGFDAKGHNEITLGTLLCILRNKQFDVDIAEEFPLLAQASEDGAWVFEVPNDLVIRLNRLNDSEIPDIASKWLQTDEMKDADNDYAENFINELKLLATESLNQQKSILMWTSL